MARKVLIQVRRGMEMNIGTLEVGELGFCIDTQKLYIGTNNGNVLLVAAQTVGDMLKSIYDTNNDGKVDGAELADSVPWLGVTGKPSSFPPDAHNHDANYEPKNANIQTHIASTSNPHGVTKSQVGLGSVSNYGIATQAEAEAGTSSSKYMTPLRTKQAIDMFALPKTGLTWNQLKGV